jgi:hypothetical protein
LNATRCHRALCLICSRPQHLRRSITGVPLRGTPRIMRLADAFVE